MPVIRYYKIPRSHIRVCSKASEPVFNRLSSTVSRRVASRLSLRGWRLIQPYYDLLLERKSRSSSKVFNPFR